jgi:predicted RNase H-like nuclease
MKDGLHVGIDGCKGKWIAVAISEESFEVDKFATISDICEKYNKADTMIIDIPIGLPQSIADIRPDKIVRKRLGPKGSSIFDTPCRQAVYAEDKAAARANNIEVLGKSLSEQSIAISKAIRQVDEFLNNNSEWKNRLLESHPEYCFMMLRNGKPVMENKKEKSGQGIRLEILRQLYPLVDKVIEKYLNDVPYRKKLDDVIDALCLAVIGKLSVENGLKSIPEEPMEDSSGIKMQIVYYI